MPVRELVIVPEYRVFCEENLCGNYNVLPACPPASGTVEEMTARVRQYETALVLMVEHTPKDYTDRQEQKAAKRHQNELTEQLINRMHEKRHNSLVPSAASAAMTMAAPARRS